MIPMRPGGPSWIPTQGRTTTLYRPQQQEPLDLLPRYHGYAFQERIPAKKENTSFVATTTSSDSSSNGGVTRHSYESDDDNVVDDGVLPPLCNRGPAASIALFRPSIPEHARALEQRRLAQRRHYPAAPRRTSITSPAVGWKPRHSSKDDAIEEQAEPTASPSTAAPVHVRSAHSEFTDKQQPHTVAATQGSVDDTAPAPPTETGEDPNVLAIRLMFQCARNGGVVPTEAQELYAHVCGDAEESPQRDSETPPLDEVAIAPLRSSAARSGRGCAMVEPTPITFLPSARHMCDNPPSQRTDNTTVPTAAYPVIQLDRFPCRGKTEHTLEELDWCGAGSSPASARFTNHTTTHAVGDATEQEQQGDAQTELIIEGSRWMFYQEQFERNILYRLEMQESPIPWYACQSMMMSSNVVTRIAAQRPALATDEDLHTRVEKAMGAAIDNLHEPRKSLAAERAAAQIAKQEEALAAAEREAEELRLLEPNPLELMYGVALREKEHIFLSACRLHGNLEQQVELILAEKAHRLEVLGHFVSCAYPEPCRCVCWDMEVLEESSIPLEPELFPPCVFTSLVLSEYHHFSDALLEEREHELRQLRQWLGMEFASTFVFECFVEDERAEWNQLMLYNEFCLMTAARTYPEAAQWCADHQLGVLHSPPKPKKQKKKRHHHRHMASSEQQVVVPPRKLTMYDLSPIERRKVIYAEPTDSPFLPFTLVLEVEMNLRIEAEGRQRLYNEEAEDMKRILTIDAARFPRSVWRSSLGDVRQGVMTVEAQVRALLEQEELTTRTFYRKQLGSLEYDDRRDRKEQGRTALFEEAERGVATLEEEAAEALLLIRRQFFHESRFLSLQHYEDGGAAAAKLWVFERSCEQLEMHEVRLRYRIQEEELADRCALRGSYALMEAEVLPFYGALYLQEASHRAILEQITFLEELQRSAVEEECALERCALFVRCWVEPHDAPLARGVPPPLAIQRNRKALPSMHGINQCRSRMVPHGDASLELNLRRSLVVDLHDFLPEVDLTTVFDV